jgi:hypothetical protein
MPQAWLPLIPSGATPINDLVSVAKHEGRWVYFFGIHAVFDHEERDRRCFRMVTAQLVSQGTCKQAEIVRTFGVSPKSVRRSVVKYQAGGPSAFFAPRRGRGATVLTEEVLSQAQALLNAGERRQDVADTLAIKVDTLRKAICQGRLSEPVVCPAATRVTDKSTRTAIDVATTMGHACSRPTERVAAAIGLLPGGASTQFEACHDVPLGGVLCALPALIAAGLLRHVDTCLRQVKGYYTTVQVLVLLAQMALCRIKTVEQLQGYPPGEFGKLMGLDRVPEVRCLRKKIGELSEADAPDTWAGLLCRDWMEDAPPELCGALYVDGHVRVYHGAQTALPKRFVSRERLCLRGTTDYWVNDALGQPYFVVSRPVDQGMLEALRTDIVPRLLRDVPRQPTPEQLMADPTLHRFVLIFDREGYSPAFFKSMWQDHRIACITYHKFPQHAWPEDEFITTDVTMPQGERLSMKLAERGSFIGSKQEGLWLREVRKLGRSGHQTSLISTAKHHLALRDAALIFSRWSQENFFAYMTKHYAIDLLSEYGTQGFPDTQRVVNPLWRQLDRTSRSLKAKLTQRAAAYAALEIHPEPDRSKLVRWQQKKADLVEEIERLEHDLLEVKAQLAQTSKHIHYDQLDAEDRFEQLKPSRKRLIDTIKMIAYRAETALVTIVREKLARHDDARALIQALCQSEADILPDPLQGTLTIRIHALSNARSNRAIAHLLTQLNDAAFNYPGTNLRMAFRIPEPANPSQPP